VVKAQGLSFPWSMKTLVLEENKLQPCNIFDILRKSLDDYAFTYGDGR